MIFRAIAALGLVCMLMPNEPDLGFGRPSSGAARLISDLAARLGVSANGEVQEGAGSTSVDDESVQASVLDRLRAVKADIARDRDRRATRAVLVERDRAGEGVR